MPDIKKKPVCVGSVSCSVTKPKRDLIERLSVESFLVARSKLFSIYSKLFVHGSEIVLPSIILPVFQGCFLMLILFLFLNAALNKC